jgi:hypothetical protein
MCYNIDTTDQFDSVPSEQHVETVMTGLMDSLGGNEGMDLSAAQVYVQGVLFADGSVRGLPLPEVAGNEEGGFFSKVGDGIKKVWEYIKKMFASIWGVFFKSDKKKMEEKVDAALADAEKELEAMEKAAPAPAAVPQVVHKAEAAIAKLEPSPEKTKLEKVVEEIKEAKAEPAKQAKELHELLPEIFKADVLDNGKIKRATDKLKGAVGRLQAKKVELDKAEKDGHSINGQEIQQYLNGLIGLPDASLGIKDIASARGWIQQSKRCKTAMGNTLGGMLSDQARYRQRIEECEKGINAYAGPKDKGNKELSKKIEALKADFACISGIIAITDTVSLAIIEISETIEKACVSVV